MDSNNPETIHLDNYGASVQCSGIINPFIIKEF